MINVVDGEKRYFDRNGLEITDGCEIRYPHGDKALERVERVYKTVDGQLGTDATNPHWIVTGRAAPCEYGIYPLTAAETELVELASLSAERRRNGEVLRELAGDVVICHEAVKPGMMRLVLEGCFGDGDAYNREALMLIPVDMASEDIDMLSDMWLTEQEKELGLPVGESCSSSSWWAGHQNDSKDAEITDKYDFLIERALMAHIPGQLRELHLYLHLAESETFLPDDFLSRFASINPGVEFVPCDGCEGVLVIDGEKYIFDHCEKDYQGSDLVYATLFVKLQEHTKETVDSLISGAVEAAKDANHDREIVSRDSLKE